MIPNSCVLDVIFCFVFLVCYFFFFFFFIFFFNGVWCGWVGAGVFVNI